MELQRHACLLLRVTCREHAEHGTKCSGGRGCPCKAFFYIVAEGSWILRCRCKHKHIEHDPVTHKYTRVSRESTSQSSPAATQPVATFRSPQAPSLVCLLPSPAAKVRVPSVRLPVGVQLRPPLVRPPASDRAAHSQGADARFRCAASYAGPFQSHEDNVFKWRQSLWH